LALTKGGKGGFPRPIEIHAHDPLRYIGDMLAWVHQAVAGVGEGLESLFLGEPAEDESNLHDRRRGRMVGSVRLFKKAGEGETEEEEWIRELMNLGVEKVCVPLKVCYCGLTNVQS
jgi:hypothetical protein